MDPRLKEAAQLEKETRELEDRLRDEYVEIGRKIGSQPPGDAPGDPLNRLADAQKKHDALRSDAEQILKTLADLEATEQQLEGIKSRLDKTAREFETTARNLGSAAAQVYAGLSLPETYRPYFEPIVKADQEIVRLEKELTTMEAEEKSKGFFGKLVSRGRSIGVRSAVGKQTEAKQDYYAKLANLLLDTSFAEHLSGDARALFDAASRQRAEIVAAQKQISDLTVAQEERHAELRRRCGDADPRERGKEIEKKLGEAQKELDLIHQSIAEALLQNRGFRPSGDAAMTGRINYVHSLRAAIQERNGRVAVLRGQLEIEELLSREKGLRKKREQLESEIKIRSDQIRTIDAEIDKALKRVDELKKNLK